MERFCLLLLWPAWRDWLFRACVFASPRVPMVVPSILGRLMLWLLLLQSVSYLSVNHFNIFTSIYCREKIFFALPSSSLTKTNCLYTFSALALLLGDPCTRHATANILALSAEFYGCITQSQHGSYASASARIFWFSFIISSDNFTSSRNSQLLTSRVVPLSGSKTKY